MSRKVFLELNDIYKQFKRLHDIKQISQMLENEDFTPVNNEALSNVSIISFVVESMYSFAGGSTSILRLAEFLSRKYKILFVICSGQSEKEFRQNAATNYKEFSYKVVQFKDSSKINADVVIATAWQTVYYAKKLRGYKFYFVQDYEPYFYEYREKYLLAKETYNMGFTMVSLGGWNKEKIEKECENHSEIYSIPFPFERREYHYEKKDFYKYQNKKEIKMVVYIKDDPKRLPVILQHMMIKLEKEFEKNGKQLSVYWFGWDRHKKVSCGKNLGKLKKEELEGLYHRADFGMVASITNISLVSVEMMASGLPIIEFEKGSFTSFFDSKYAILTDFNVKELYKKIENVLKNPSMIEIHMVEVQRKLSDLSWKKNML